MSNDSHKSKGGWMRHTRPSSLGRSGKRLRYTEVTKQAFAAIASMDSAMSRRAGRRSAKRVSMNRISTVSNRGKVRFMVYSGRMNAKRLLQFLKPLIRTSEHKIFLILDNLPVHHARPVKAWLAEAHNIARIEVFFLPTYSPELNPDEYLNCDLKAGVHSKPPARDARQLEKKIRAHMKTFQKSPARIQKYFKHPKIAYAA